MRDLAEHIRWQEFASREELAEALARSIGSSLEGAVAARGRAALAVSGGSTPKLLFATLSRIPLPWANVTVTLCDERFEPPSSPRSNEKLVRENLLRAEAQAASFLPLFREGVDESEAAKISEAALLALTLPLDIAVLGMGEDGHTLSFFPDARELEQALDPANPSHVIALHAASTEEPRLTLTMPVVKSARRVILHLEGAAKREAFERALASEPGLPIKRVIEQTDQPVEVFWAP